MASFSVILDTKVFEKKLSRLERQALPAARLRATNNVAFAARPTVQRYMSLVFDRPTPFVIRGVLVEKATSQRPVAEVFIGEGGVKGGDPKRALQHHVRGGLRTRKRSERALERLGLLTGKEVIVPARAIRLDRYGNIPGSRMVQILSQLRAFSEVGFNANVTTRSKARNPKRKQYFWPNPATRNRLPLGVYERHGNKGKQIRPVLLVAKEPRYRKVFDFVGVVTQDVRRRFEQEFRRALAFELRRGGRR